jgi:N-methylhydantoinase A/oxoprolinase/acetone carboxylase beta subunit
MMRVVGVDIGGTFTDFMLYDTASGAVHVHKVPSTPAEPERAMVTGLEELCAEAGLATADVTGVFHGTTVATNAVLQHEGAVAGMITTRGFRDIVHIGRHQRPLHYSVMQDIPWQARPFVRRRHRKVVTERIVPPTGEVLTPLDEDEVRAVAAELRDDGVEAVAVCFLFSYLNPEHERRAAAIVREEMPGAFVTTSADIFPQFREFERFTTATMSAFVGPTTGSYLDRLATALDGNGAGSDLHVMMSSGGVASARTAAERPVTLLLSGPAAGILGGQWAGALAGRRRLITFDMGGTSADIGIVTEDGVSEASARDTWVGGYPLLVPMLDVHTIGAGGGSIAYVDEGGAFRVGPRSAGASPGPACYGQGGVEPTISDAHVVLGRIDPERFLGGRMRLDRGAAVAAVERLAGELGLGLLETAEGILTIATSNMARAIRSRTIEKGHDPREFALVAFGGAGPLHAAELADTLDIPEVLVPPHPGITSAAGLLTSDLKYDQMRTVFQLQGSVDADRLNSDLDELEAELRGMLQRDGVSGDDIEVMRALDCRYVGQGYELRVTLADGPFSEQALEQFHVLHEREYGSAYSDPIEIVNARVTAIGRRPPLEALPVPSGTFEEALVGESDGAFRLDGSIQTVTTRFYDRNLLPLDESLPGPAVVFHPDTTTVVPPGWNARADASGNLMLTKGGAR